MGQTINVWTSRLYDKDGARLGSHPETIQALALIFRDAGIADETCEVPKIPEVKKEKGESDEAFKKRREELLFSMLSFRSPDPKKVPLAKLAGGVGWIFTKEECELINEVLSLWWARISDGDPNPTGVTPDKLKKFLAIMAKCAQGEGCQLM
jgi:hypothetical protein